MMKSSLAYSSSSWTVLWVLLGSLVTLGNGHSSGYLYRSEKASMGLITEYTTVTNRNFFTFTENPRIVEFYSPSCGACINFKPKYIELAQETKQSYPDVEFHAVSCEQHNDICRKFSIMGFPSLMAFPAGDDEGSTIARKLTGYSVSLLANQLKLPTVMARAAPTRRAEEEGGDDEGMEKSGGEWDDNDSGEGDYAVQSQSGYQSDENNDDGTGEEENDDTTYEEDDNSNQSNEGFDDDEEEVQSDEEEDDDNFPDFDNDDESHEHNIHGDDNYDDTDDESSGEATYIKPPTANAWPNMGMGGPGMGAPGMRMGGPGMGAPGMRMGGPGMETPGMRMGGGAEMGMSGPGMETPGMRMGGGAGMGMGGPGMGAPGMRMGGPGMETPGMRMGGGAGMGMGGPGMETPGMRMGGGAGMGMGGPGIGNPRAQGDRAGYVKAKLQKNEMNRWQEHIAERKKRLVKRQHFGNMIQPHAGRKRTKPHTKVAPEEMTATMKAQTPDTPEYRARRQRLMDHIEKMRTKHSRRRKKKHLPPTQVITTLKKDTLPYKRDIKKPSFVRKQAEKIPVVKRFVRMSEEEELILDASMSFVHVLKMGAFLSDEELTSERSDALKNWLHLLSVSLPPEWGLHKLIDTLSVNIRGVSKSRSLLMGILMKHPIERGRWSKSCDKSRVGGGFACGFWKLLHIVTVGVAEHRGGLNLIESKLVGEDTQVFSPLEAADVIRNFMVNFYTCKDCRDHFRSQYDECDNNRRCDRLTDSTDGSVADWKELPLWLWEFHNEVSVRIGREKEESKTKYSLTSIGRKAKSSRQSEIKYLWPDIGTCLTCFNDDGTWDESEVFRMLERTYWPDADLDPKSDRLLHFDFSDGDSTSFGFLWLLVFVIVGAVYQLIGKHSFAVQRSLLVAKQIVANRSNGKSNKARSV